MEKRDIKGTSRSQNAIFDVPFEDAVELAKIANGIILDKVSFEISIGDTVKIIAEVMGATVDIEADEQRIRPEMTEVGRLWADNSKAKRLTGWKLRYSGRDGLKRGLEETVEWFMKKENLRRYKADAYNI